MDWVVTVVWDSFADLVSEIAGPSATRFPLMSTVVELLTEDCWAVSGNKQAKVAREPAKMQRFTIPG
jgi:hypothetical protein